jgi:hypothetical protein
VSRLEVRIHELEHPNETTPAVTLHDPYSPYHESEAISMSAPSLFIPQVHPHSSALSPFSPTSTTSGLPSGGQLTDFAALGAVAGSISSGGSSTSPIQRYTSSPFLGAEVRSCEILVSNCTHRLVGTAFSNNSALVGQRIP